jgi:transposase
MFSEERKLAVRLLYDHLRSIRKTAEILKVSKSSVQRWVAEGLMRGQKPDVVQDAPKQRQKSKLLMILHLVDIALKTNPFQTCRLLVNMLLKKYDINVSKELVRVAIKNLEYTRKKARFYGLAKNALALNRRFIKLRNHYIENGHPIYSIDETGFGRFSYNRAYGYAKRGFPLYIRKQKARMTSISVLACASKDGWTGYKKVTGGVNRIMFSEFIKSLNLPKGAVMLLDNASIHKGDVVKQVLNENGIIPLYVLPSAAQQEKNHHILLGTIRSKNAFRS